MQVLPIDAHLDAIVVALRQHGCLVLEAPPGAGKTTRVPAALLQAGVVGAGELWVLEPRRLAARLAARRVAEELGEPLGERVGYQVRFESVRSPRTRLLFMTEGLLARRLLDDPLLAGVGGVVLDEFHERHLDTDLALAAIARLRRGPRPDLQVVVMSATLQTDAVARFLDAAPVVRSAGRLFPLTIEHAAMPDPRPLEQQVRAAVNRLGDDGRAGTTLVFLPGAREIRRAREALTDDCLRRGVELCTLHGEMQGDAQDAALRFSGKPKIILSTNVAESSVTVEQVTTVIDSGLARIAGHAPWSGLPTLDVRRIARAACIQRAGRAGRTQPGRVMRLFTRADFDGRAEFERPEIQRIDLCGLQLTLAALARDGAGLWRWLDDPPVAAVQAATELLCQLGALDGSQQLTPRGERLLRYPAHPRLARLLEEAASRGVVDEGALVAALLLEGEARPPRSGRSDRVSGSDLWDKVVAWRGGRSDDVEPGARWRVDRMAKDLARRMSREAGAAAQVENELARCLLVAFPDRVAQRRGDGTTLLLAAGGEAQLAPTSAVRQAELLVAVEATERSESGRNRVVVEVASAVEPEWLLDIATPWLVEADEVDWNEARQKVERWSRLRYGSCVLGETRRDARGHAPAAALLADHALRPGIEALVDGAALGQLRGRVALVRRLRPGAELPTLDASGLAQAVRTACLEHDSLSGLKHLELLGAYKAQLTSSQRQILESLAPEHVTLPGRKRAPITYGVDAEPFVASRLQDFFGLAEGPRVGGGAVPLVLHLLAPSQRPVQITADLAGFWQRHYPTIRRELCRKYPRHPWPEQPTRAPAAG